MDSVAATEREEISPQMVRNKSEIKGIEDKTYFKSLVGHLSDFGFYAKRYRKLSKLARE